MSKLEAAEELRRQYNNEEQVIDVDASFEEWNWRDVLVSVKKVSEETFGWIRGKHTWNSTPTEIDIVVNLIKGQPVTEKCFYGKYTAATWEDAIITVTPRYGVVYISVSCKKKFSAEVSEFFNAIREHLKKHSIYRGKTVVISKGTSPDGGESVEMEIIENLGEENIILNQKEELVIERFVIGSLLEPGKRCWLFTGEYGTGKTETAMRVGRVGNGVGMTFFYCKDSSIFETFLNVSKQYQPCIVFLEDVDEIGAGTQRDTRMNSILNTLDGVQTKGNNIKVIFTTNHEKRINPALRRPGRIDLIVHFGFPERDTKEKIYMQLLKDVPGAAGVNYNEVVDATPDVQGAVIAQICTRAKQLARREGSLDTGSVVAAIASMEYQISFMKDEVEKIDDDKDAMQKFAGAIAKAVKAAK
jgi:hypothetical protein